MGSELPSSVQEQNLGVLIDSSLKTLSQHSVIGKEENCVRKYKERNKEQKGKVYAVIYSCAVAMFQMLFRFSDFSWFEKPSSWKRYRE